MSVFDQVQQQLQSKSNWNLLQMLTWNQKVSLGFCIFITAGYYYNLDWPQSLETPLRQPPYSLSSIKYNMIYLATSLPIFFLSVPFGILMDRIPLKHSVWIFLGIQVVSQVLIGVLFTFIFDGFYYVVLVMRMIFGLTTETSYTLQSLIVEKVIEKKNLDFVLNICYSWPLIFGAFNSLISTSLYDRTLKTYVPLFVGASICLLSLVAGLVMVKRVEHKTNNDNKLLIKNSQQEQEEEKQQSSCNMKDVKEVSWEFWIFIATVFFGESSIGPYFDNLTDLLVKRFNIPYTTAGQISMIPTGFSPIFSLCFFYLLKHHQSKRRIIIIVLNFLAVICHITMLLIPNTQTPTVTTYFFSMFALLCMSASFAGYLGVLEVSAGMLVPKHLLGIAYGSVAAVNSLSMALLPLSNGLIIGSGSTIPLGYKHMQYAFIPMSVIYFLLAIYMKMSKSKVFAELDKDRKGEQDEEEEESNKTEKKQGIKQSLLESNQSIVVSNE